MAFDTSGVFTRDDGATGWQDAAAAHIKIRADDHDDSDNDLAAGLSACITRHGWSQIAADIPWNGRKITNLGLATNGGDAASKTYVDTVQGWPNSKYIDGADLEGRLNFTSPTGINGITWTSTDLSWVAKIGEANKTSHRLVLNDKVDATGTDQVIIDDGGRVNSSGWFTQNLSWDGDEWRTIDPGLATSLRLLNSTLTVAGLDAATITDAYKPAAMRNFFAANNQAGSPTMDLIKTASGKFTAIRGLVGDVGAIPTLRWQMQLGDSAAESSPRIGSGFQLHSFDNTGAAAFLEMHIDRSTHKVAFGGMVQPGTGLASIAPGGSVTGQYYNVWHQAGVGNHLTINGTDQGIFQFTSDYRSKRGVAPLGSVWDKVKALRPVKYKAIADDDGGRERWGFVAHELQETLTETAASGHKDGEAHQSPNLFILLTAALAALQEAMARIEALEARP